MLFRPKDKIDDKYSVVFPIKQGAYAETYRVKDNEGHRYFFKLIDKSLLQNHQKDSDGCIREIKMMEALNHPNLPEFKGKGEISLGGKEYAYVLTDFLSSETLSDRLVRSQTLSVYDTKEIALGLLEAVKYLHSQEKPIIHNEITALNVLIDLTTEDLKKVRLIDFGYARYLDEAYEQSIDGLNWFYLAPERFDGSSTEQSDLYSVGALMYQLLFGMLPWFCDLSNIAPDRRKQYILRQKSTQLLMPHTQKFELDDQLLNIIQKALVADVDNRFQTADEFIDALKGNINVTTTYQAPATASDRADAFSARKSGGHGFEDVAGMQDLKHMLMDDVINVLKNPEKAKKYRLQIPNGILFYGPPGCGKSFFAEKFAEEAGLNFQLVKSSDLASIYVHGAQEKIGKLFDEARKKAPAIICFDEFDALVPARGNTGNEHQSGEVNEFLSQMNNCGERGVFLIASTNRPDMIDSAILRRGRIDKIIYIPVPDKDARAAMFETHLKGRPYDSDIEFAELAKLSENYVASDIAFVVNTAAKRAAFSDAKISHEMLVDAIKQTRPSVTSKTIKDYEQMRARMEGVVADRPHIGFY